MSDEPIIRPYENGDETKIVDLLKNIFPLWNEKSLDHWRWKYLESPIESDIVLAELDSKIIGVGHRIILNYKLGENTELCTYGDDWGVHPDHREKGIWSKLLALIDERRLEKGVKMMYTVTVNPIVKETFVKRGRLLFPHKIRRLIKVEDINKHLKYRPRKDEYLVRLGLPILKIFNKVTSYTLGFNQQVNDLKISDVTKFDEKVDELWNKLRNDYLFTLEKKKEYLDWRLNEKGGNYHVKQAYQNNDLVGFIAFEIRTRNNYTEINILDLVTPHDRMDVAFSLIKEICDYAERNEINVLYYQNVVGNPYEKVFSKLGFLDSGSSPYVVLDITREDYNILQKARPEQVSFTYITTMH